MTNPRTALPSVSVGVLRLATADLAREHRGWLALAATCASCRWPAGVTYCLTEAERVFEDYLTTSIELAGTREA